VVAGNAMVFGDAVVAGNANVFGNAMAYGNAVVYGDATVAGNANVAGNAVGETDAYRDLWKKHFEAKVFGEFKGLRRAAVEYTVLSNFNFDTLPASVTEIKIDGVTYVKKTIWTKTN